MTRTVFHAVTCTEQECDETCAHTATEQVAFGPVYDRWGVKVFHGDSLKVLKTWPDECVDAVICDPQYGLSDIESDQVVAAMLAWAQGDRERVPDAQGFMGADWDAFVPPPAIWDECFRVLKPGGHLAAFTAARNVDIAGLSIRMAGFRIRDDLGAWVYSQGMPKGQDISKAIDKARDDRTSVVRVTTWLGEQAAANGVTRPQIDRHMGTSDMAGWWTSTLQHRCAMPTPEQWVALRELIGFGDDMDDEVARLNGRKGTWGNERADRVVTSFVRSVYSDAVDTINAGSPVLDESAAWQGWNTQLAPAHEPILLARKPVSEGTIAANVLRHGTGGLHTDACRVGEDNASVRVRAASTDLGLVNDDGWTPREVEQRSYPKGATGRFPSNLLFCHHPGCGPEESPNPCVDDCHVRALDDQVGPLKSGANPTRRGADKFRDTYSAFAGQKECVAARGADEGQPSGFYPTFRYEAKAPKTERPQVDGQSWITVKPVGLMRWLVRLLTPPGGTVLDWCCGSGATGQAVRAEGLNAVLIDRDPVAIKLTKARLDARPRTEAPTEPGTTPAAADDHVHDLLDLLGDAS